MGDRVVTTQWSLIVAARSATGGEARAALERLCSTYWQPLYWFVRHRGWDPEDARDLTQAYFAELLEKDFLADVDAARGRFRSFLFSSMRNFLAHQRDRAATLKRGGGSTTLSLDLEGAERTYAAAERSPLKPDELFEHRWALTVIDRALTRLRNESAASGRSRQFELLRPYLTESRPGASYREIAADLEMSEGAVKVAVHRMRRRFGECLRGELAETVADPADVDDELRHLLAVLRR